MASNTSAVTDSPSLRTRSRTSHQLPPPPPPVPPTTSAPPGVSEPTRKRGKGKKVTITNQTDEQIWDLTDEAIIEAHQQTWTSSEYNHYKVSIRRQEPPMFPARSMDLVFTCHIDPAHVVYRPRMGTSHGTTNLKNTRLSCERKHPLSRAITAVFPGAVSDVVALSIAGPPYSEHLHRTLIALRCARNHRPFNIVTDPEYLAELELLRPGTKPPHPSTVSRDVRDIHAFAAHRVRTYFASFDGVVHCVMDGWSSPLVTSYLGVVISWWRDGRLRRASLDFLKLHASHTGQYQADKVHQTFEWFGLVDKMHTMCMDNASNCDTTARHYSLISPRFLGVLWRTRCTPHEIQIIARAFLSFFWQPGTQNATSTSVQRASGSKRKAKKSSAPAARASKRMAASASTSTEPIPVPLASTSNISTTEVDSEDYEDAGPPTPTATETVQSFGHLLDPDDPESQLDGQDPAQIAHVTSIVQAAAQAAEEILDLEHITLSLEEKSTAQGILTKASGLARKVNDSPKLKGILDRIVEADIGNGLLHGQRTRLPRRVATRWNSDLECLNGYLKLFTQVKKLAAEVPELESFLLTPDQHALAKELVDQLQIFDETTRLFSLAEVPLIHEVVPLLEDVAARLEMLSRGLRPDKRPVSNVMRLAAQAALVVYRKYEALGKECEVYEIAMVMCPHWKLNFFSSRGRNSQDIERIRARVVTRFYDWNPPNSRSNSSSPQRPTHSNAQANPQARLPAAELSISNHSTASSKSMWSSVTAGSALPAPQLTDPDSIEQYLSEPWVDESTILSYGGVLQYWEAQKPLRPRLAKLALAYLSAPASSVDAERAFSSGRLMVNHTQHGMSSNSFVAQVVLGSWIKEGLVGNYEDLSVALDRGSSDAM